MATLAILPPEYATTGGIKEPIRGSLPLGPAATFFEHDFLIQGPNIAAPQVNGTLLAPPTTVVASIVNSGGSITSGTYYVVTTYLNANGETLISPPSAVTTTGTGTLTVQSPPNLGDAFEYNVYMGTVVGTYHLANATPLALGGAYVKTSAYSAGGAAPPTTNGTGLAAPSTPSLSAGGTTGPNVARTEYVTITYVNQNGETVASVEASQALTATQLLTVASPAASVDATGYNVYGALVSGQEVLQNATPIAIGTNWTEPTTGLVTPGVQRAAANQPGMVNGVPVILGLADHDYNATYGGPQGGVQPGLSDQFGRPQFNQNVFGITEQYVPISTDAKSIHFISAGGGIRFAICLKQAWDPGYLGRSCGLAIDSTTNAFIADLTATNPILQIVGTVDGPGWGGPGDVNKRIKVAVLGTYIALAA